MKKDPVNGIEINTAPKSVMAKILGTIEIPWANRKPTPSNYHLSGGTFQQKNL